MRRHGKYKGFLSFLKIRILHVNALTAYAYAKRRGLRAACADTGRTRAHYPVWPGILFVLPAGQAGATISHLSAAMWYLRLSARMSSYRMALTAPYRYP